MQFGDFREKHCFFYLGTFHFFSFYVWQGKEEVENR